MLTRILIVAGCLLLFGVPLALGIYWGKKYRLPAWTFIAGVLVYELFAYSFRQSLGSFLFPEGSAAAAALDGNPVLYALYYGFSAGILEELGRAVGFAVFLKRFRQKEAAVAFGIGYSGIEGILTAGISFFTYTLFIFGVRFASEEQNELILGMLGGASSGVVLLSMFERISFTLLHLGLSVLVFSGVREKKTAARILPAVLLHTAALIPTGLYQKGAVPRWAAEGWLFLAGALVFFYAYRIYRTMEKK